MMNRINRFRKILAMMIMLLSMILGIGSLSAAYAAGAKTAVAAGKSKVTLTGSRKKKKKNSNSSKNSSSKKKNDSNSNAKSSRDDTDGSDTEQEIQVEEDGMYTSKEEVAAYIHSFDHLPDNFITKKEAQKLGWISSEGNLDEVAPGKSIGGDRFGNYEELLPVKDGRNYYECDIDYEGGFRGAKRIIFSDDGLIYYTEDHYETFTQLY